MNIETRLIERSGNRPETLLVVGIPDGFISSIEARSQKEDGTWSEPTFNWFGAHGQTASTADAYIAMFELVRSRMYNERMLRS